MKPKNLIWHIVGVIAFLVLPVFFSPRPPGTDFSLSRPDIRDLIANSFMVIFFYLNYYFFIPRVYFRKKYFTYGVIIIFALSIICLLPSLMTGFIPWQFQFHEPADHPDFRGHPEHGNFLMMINHHIFLYTGVVLFSILLRLRDRILKLEKAKYEIEIQSLRRQVKPHFLFNTLNGLYSTALKEEAHSTAGGIFKLSHIMRYVFINTGRKKVSLSDEITYITDYVDLQKMRMDKNVLLHYEVTGDYSGKEVAPLVLIPFIENAFKHGVNPDEDSEITILIQIIENTLKLEVKNRKVNVVLKDYESSGKGIENIRSRLEYLYPDNHKLMISNTDEEFSVVLNIELS